MAALQPFADISALKNASIMKRELVLPVQQSDHIAQKMKTFSTLFPKSLISSIVFFMIFGRTDLRIGVSGAKFDAEVDFEVHFARVP